LRAGRRRTGAWKTQNTRFIAVDLSDFDETAEPETFGCITPFDAVDDQARPLRVLEGIYRALKPDGVYLIQDISGSSHVHKDIEHPIGTFLYTISRMHGMHCVPGAEGEGPGAMWGEEKTREYLPSVPAFGRSLHNAWRMTSKTTGTW
jgi:SAM-dependent methyltransferase